MKLQKLNAGAKLIAVLSLVFMINASAQTPNKKLRKDKSASVEEIFKQRDKNEDGKLEKTELVGLISNDFVKVDVDQDGFLSLEEFKKAPRFQKGRKQRRGRPDMDELFERMDANSDDKLSRDEVKGPLTKKFKEIDTNEDGYLSQEELKKAPRPDRNRPMKRKQ